MTAPLDPAAVVAAAQQADAWTPPNLTDRPASPPSAPRNAEQAPTGGNPKAKPSTTD